MANQYSRARQGTFSLSQFLIRLFTGAVVLAITAALTPGFRIAGLWPLALGAVVLAVLDYGVLRLFGADASPFGRGISGFLLAAVIIYLTQYFVAGFSVTLFGAVIGALIYGVVDAIIPGRSM